MNINNYCWYFICLYHSPDVSRGMVLVPPFSGVTPCFKLTDKNKHVPSVGDEQHVLHVLWSRRDIWTLWGGPWVCAVLALVLSDNIFKETMQMQFCLHDSIQLCSVSHWFPSLSLFPKGWKETKFKVHKGILAVFPAIPFVHSCNFGNPKTHVGWRQRCKNGRHGTDSWPHPVVSRYLYYSTSLLDHGRHVCSCLQIWALNHLLKGWRHDHGPPNVKGNGKSYRPCRPGMCNFPQSVFTRPGLVYQCCCC